MFKPRLYFKVHTAFCIAAFLTAASPVQASQAPEIKFDHIHTYAETVSYMEDVIKAYPQLTTMHKIGKSYLGKDLLVLEVTNQATGKGQDKPGYWIDGCMHSGEVAGGEMCLHTIHTLITKYGKDPMITRIVDTKTFYFMPAPIVRFAANPAER